MIVEGIVSTWNADGTLNVSPMGPLLPNRLWHEFVLRPFDTSTTFDNLQRTREGVFHVIDDVELIARAAVGELANPATLDVDGVPVPILADACQWYFFHVTSIVQTAPRHTLECRVLERGHGRDMLGLNRAQYAVLELAILATRLHLHNSEHVMGELSRLAPLVEKTAGDRERAGFLFIRDYLLSRIP